MIRSALITAALITASVFAISAQAQPVSGQRATSSGANNRLMIVDRDKGKVIYDDGRNDLFCSTRRVFVGYNNSGRPIYRRTMKCR